MKTTAENISSNNYRNTETQRTLSFAESQADVRLSEVEAHSKSMSRPFDSAQGGIIGAINLEKKDKP